MTVAQRQRETQGSGCWAHTVHFDSVTTSPVSMSKMGGDGLADVQPPTIHSKGRKKPKMKRVIDAFVR